jgi:hypothetical protein
MKDHSPRQKHKPLPREKLDMTSANGPVSSRQWTEEERQRVNAAKPPEGKQPFVWRKKS